MIKGQLVAGSFGALDVRVKSGTYVELGELVVVEEGSTTYLLQVYDLKYGSQISSQQLELIAGMNLEEEQYELMDASLRTYSVATVRPVLVLGKAEGACKRLPPFFSLIRALEKKDLSFLQRPHSPVFMGTVRSGSRVLDHPVYLPAKEMMCHHVLIAASTGKGKSNLMSCLLWDLADNTEIGLLVLDPHDEYFGRVGFGLKDHPAHHVSYYTPIAPPPGAYSLKINLRLLKPRHFHGAIALSDPQRQCLSAFYRMFKEEWVFKIFERDAYYQIKEGKISFQEDTLAVVQRKLLSVLQLEYQDKELVGQGIFDSVAGQHTVQEVCSALEQAKTVIVDTSFFSGSQEILIGSIFATELFERYKHYKRKGVLHTKPVVGFVLEEAPRVLGKKVLEQGSNVFESIAREGRKFQVGLVAITQIPSEIPKNILANMNTKVILGMEMATERSAVIESASQDLSQDSRTIASLDKGEAFITSTFTKFAIPVKFPLYQQFARVHVDSSVLDDSLFL